MLNQMRRVLVRRARGAAGSRPQAAERCWPRNRGPCPHPWQRVWRQGEVRCARAQHGSTPRPAPPNAPAGDPTACHLSELGKKDGFLRRCWSDILLAKAKRVKLVGDELQVPKAEALGGLERWSHPRPYVGYCGELRGAKTNCLALACCVDDSDRGNHPIADAMKARSAPHGRR